MRYLFTIYCFCLVSFTNAQIVDGANMFAATKIVVGDAGNFSVDNLGNLYVLTTGAF